jgi:hypothetical protein
MDEWLRPGLWEVLTIKLRGIEPGIIQITKKPTGEGLRSLVTVAGIDHILGVWLAVWLKPGLRELLTNKLRGIEPGQILITKSPQGRVCAESRPLVIVGGVSLNVA